MSHLLGELNHLADQVWLCLPPISEQRVIVAHIGIATSELDTAISRLGHEIDLFREYRMRLVADVVTGRLDVREGASQLPEETEMSVEGAPDDDTDESQFDDAEAAA